MIGMTKEPVLSSSASRARRYRQRRRDGDVVVQVEVNVPALNGLARYGFLDQDDTCERDDIANAIKLVLDGIAKNALAAETGWIYSLPCASRVASRLVKAKF